MMCFLCGETLMHVPPVIIGGFMGQPARWVHQECLDACSIAEDIFHARALAKYARIEQLKPGT